MNGELSFTVGRFSVGIFFYIYSRSQTVAVFWEFLRKTCFVILGDMEFLNLDHEESLLRLVLVILIKFQIIT